MAHPDDFDPVAWCYDAVPVPSHGRKLGRFLRGVQGTVVDFGGGTGKQSVRAFDADRTRIVVVDVARKMLHRARRKRRPVHLVQGSAARVPVADGVAAAVLCTEAFHHFAGIEEDVVREAARILRPDGVLVVEEPDPERLLGRLMAWGEHMQGMTSVFRAPGVLAALIAAHFHEVQDVRTGRFTYAVIARRPRASPQPL